MDLAALQRGFAAALAGDGGAVVGLVHDGATGSSLDAAGRLSLYRESSASNRAGALCSAYPVVRQLVGEAFFHTLARAYVTDWPLAQADLNAYGEAFPTLLAQYPAAAPLGYLPDMARVEWFVHRSFYAPDHPALDLQALARVPPSGYGDLRFLLHPSVGLLRSPWPVGAIWQWHQGLEDGAESHSGNAEHADATEESSVAIVPRPEAVVVARRGGSPEVRVMDPGPYAFLEACAAGADFATAVENALAATPDLDIPALLPGLVRDGVLASFRPAA